MVEREQKARAALRRVVGIEEGEPWPAFAWPGGYPLAYNTDDCDTLCAQCMNDEPDVHFAGDGDGWRVDGAQVHWEGPAEHCAHCNAAIPSAYGDPDELDDTVVVDHGYHDECTPGCPLCERAR